MGTIVTAVYQPTNPSPRTSTRATKWEASLTQNGALAFAGAWLIGTQISLLQPLAHAANYVLTRG